MSRISFMISIEKALAAAKTQTQNEETLAAIEAALKAFASEVRTNVRAALREVEYQITQAGH